MKVAFLTTDNREPFKDYSGTTPYFGPAPEAVLHGLAKMPGIELHVVSCIRRKVSSPKQLGPNVFFHSLHVPKIGWIRTGYQGCIRAVRRKLREIQPDIVHGQGTELDSAIDAIFSGFPNVVTVHGIMTEIGRVLKSPIGSFTWLAARLENFTLKRTEGVFCNSEHTERLVRPRARRTWRVPNAVREEFFGPPSGVTVNRKKTLINVGVIGPGKRQLDLLNVAENLRHAGLDFEFVFVGYAAPTNTYTQDFLKRIKPMQEAGYARYVGLKPVNELITLLDGSDAMVHFPPEESFGLVVAEAIARNLKLFADRVGGIVDIANAVPGAELFERDDWAGLTSAIGNWLKSGAPRPTEVAHIMRQRYHPEVIALRHIEIYQEVLTQYRKAA
jgi:glycosyltransferase involved in cell wall biosynthesis